MKKVAINGMGRIGRAVFKVISDISDLELVAVNDMITAENLAYLLNHDSVYGRYEKEIKASEKGLFLEGRYFTSLSEKEPENLPWKALGIDIVFECTGKFTKKEDAARHIKAGAKTVLLSAPSSSEGIGTVLHGVNKLKGGSNVISCASCTTNCIAPVVEIMGRRIGVKKAIMTTVHAYTSSQALVDSPNRRFARGRAAAINLVPTSTGAAMATVKALPEFEGKFDGLAVRAPVPVGSIADITFVSAAPTSVEEVNDIFREESLTPRYRDVLGISEEPMVSTDIIKDPRASVIDLSLTKVIDKDLVKIMSWYDNEWGYSNQMARVAMEIALSEEGARSRTSVNA